MLSFQNGVNAGADKYGKGVKYISVSDILNNKYITYDVIKGLVDIDAETYNNFMVEYGDIVFQRSSETFEDIGRSNVYLDETTPSTFGGFVIRGKKIGEYNPLYFKYLLDAPSSRKKVIRMGAGSQHYNIGQNGLERISLMFPSMFEQEKIGGFLAHIDERIDTQSKIIEELQSQKNWICQQFFMQRYASQKGWTKTILSDILTERKTYDKKGNLYPHATLSKEGINEKSERYDRDFLVKNEDKAYKITHYNDICYNPANLKFGVICRNTFGSAIFSPIYITFEVNSKYNPSFIGYYLTNNDFINRIRKYEEGTIYERMAVSPEDFLRGEIYIPPIELQNKIVEIISKLEEKIENELAVLRKLKEQKKYLLSNMFI